MDNLISGPVQALCCSHLAAFSPTPIHTFHFTLLANEMQRSTESGSLHCLKLRHQIIVADSKLEGLLRGASFLARIREDDAVNAVSAQPHSR